MIRTIVNKLHYDLMRSFGETLDGIPQLNIGVVGLPGSGKSNYVAVALETLRNPIQRNGEDFLSGLKAPSAVYKNPANEYLWFVQSIFLDRKPVQEGTRKTELRKIEFVHDKRMYEFNLFDTKGGDFADGTFDNYFFKDSDAYIITVDPLNIPEVRLKFKENGYTEDDLTMLAGNPPPRDTKPLTEALADFSRLTKSKNKPLAIVFTKFDLLLNDTYLKMNQLASSVNIYQPNAYVIENGTVSLEKIRESSREVEDLLKKLNLVSLINRIPTISNQYMFFAVSSYGQPPNPSGYLEDIKPHRVLDPILWLLKLKGFV